MKVSTSAISILFVVFSCLTPKETALTMDQPSSSMYTWTCVIFLLGFLIALFFYLHRKSAFWKRKGVPSYGNIFSGCFGDYIFVKKSLADVILDFYLHTKKHRLVGTFMFGRPILILNDPEIIKRVLVSDFGSFNSRGLYYDSKNDPLSGNLFFLDGAEWKTMRSKLSPYFTSINIKHMFVIMLHCINRLDDVLNEETPMVRDARLVMSSLSIDVIATVAFGVHSTCVSDASDEFGYFARNMNNPNLKDFLRVLVLTHVHWLAKALRMKMLREPIDEFFKDMVRKMVADRERFNYTRKDFMEFMIRLKNSGVAEGALNNSIGVSAEGVTVDEIAGQAFLFFIAGFETTSQANTLTLLELAKHPEIQRRVQEECDRVMEQTNGQITYDAVNTEMTYTEQVLHETMRMYPGLQVLQRCALKTSKIPSTDIEVERGTTVWIPFTALHRDPETFPDPDKYDPDRFSEKNKASIPHGAYMPFGIGPRQCIGRRFGLIQMKSVMLYLLSRYDIDVVEETPLSVKLNPKCFFPNPMGKFYLKFTPRTKNVT